MMKLGSFNNLNSRDERQMLNNCIIVSDPHSPLGVVGIVPVRMGRLVRVLELEVGGARGGVLVERGRGEEDREARPPSQLR